MLLSLQQDPLYQDDPVVSGHKCHFWTKHRISYRRWCSRTSYAVDHVDHYFFREKWLYQDVQRYITVLKGRDSRKLGILCSRSTPTPVISAVCFNSVLNNCWEFPHTLQSAVHGCVEWFPSWHASDYNHALYVPTEVVKTPTGGPSAPGNPDNPDLPWGPCLRENRQRLDITSKIHKYCTFRLHSKDFWNWSEKPGMSPLCWGIGGCINMNYLRCNHVLKVIVSILILLCFTW